MAPVPRRGSAFAPYLRAIREQRDAGRFASARIYEEHNTWHEIGAPDTGSTVGSGWAIGTRPPQFLLDPAGIGHLRGDMTKVSGASGIMAMLPTDVCPLGVARTLAITRDGASISGGEISLASGGQLLTDGAIANGSVVSLDALHWVKR